jgi:hypothetical protein
MLSPGGHSHEAFAPFLFRYLLHYSGVRKVGNCQETDPLMTDKDFWSSRMFTSLTRGYTSALLQTAILLLLKELSWQWEVSIIFSGSLSEPKYSCSAVIRQTRKWLLVSFSLHAAKVDFTESYITPGMYLYVLLLLSLDWSILRHVGYCYSPSVLILGYLR